MWAPSIVVRDPRGQDSSKMSLVVRDQPVQTLPAYGPDQPFTEGIGLRQPDGVFSTRSPIAATARSKHGA
jgi:hypothetical protein